MHAPMRVGVFVGVSGCMPACFHMCMCVCYVCVINVWKRLLRAHSFVLVPVGFTAEDCSDD